ncbi:SDR family oxidoreductase [Nocardia sp. CA2R105]|uniref:SDR family NAD(P)-dependent oxidoreductase n=1 Tax=Nocardia coffeae TaxID=2873381 RepID=UPI001CA73164|nr:SDR family oxidoreductase [Nocardia coffeae]MBY8856839.1 SDR family oxidoreductase [Nocardia coffeae]
MTARLRIPPVPDTVFPGLAGQTAVVVGGAGGGVGTATVAMLVWSGAKVLVVDHAAERLEQLAGRFADAVTGVPADVTTEAGIRAFEQAVSDIAVHSLVNVVGGVAPAEIGHFLELTAAQWQSSIALNFEYAVHTSRIAALRMAEVGCGGSLVNLSVSDARRAMPWFSPYGAARSALEAATRTMAVELGPLGICANSVAWGLIDSPRAHSGTGSDGHRERELIPLGRRGKVAEVASMVLFLVSDLGSYTTGQNLVVDGGLSLRASHDGPRHNIPEFLESEPARRTLQASFARITGVSGTADRVPPGIMPEA